MYNIKVFDHFSDAINELKTLIPEIKQYINSEYDITTPEELTLLLFQHIKEDFPSVENIDYPKTLALSISANEVGFKGKRNLAFGWRTIITDDCNVKYSFRVSVLGHSLACKKTDMLLNEHGWKQLKMNRTSYNSDRKKSNNDIKREVSDEQ